VNNDLRTSDSRISDLIKILNLSLEKSIKCQTTQIAFQHAIKIYINKPQVVNKWVAGSVIDANLKIDSLQSLNESLKTILSSDRCLLFEIREFISKSSKIFENLKYIIINDLNHENYLFCPLNLSDVDKKYSSIRFCHLLQYDSNRQQINLYIGEENKLNEETRAKNLLQIKWLTENLMPKLANWCLNVQTNTYVSCAKLNTLTLYDNMVEDYMKLYQRLKEVYYLRFADSWFELTNTCPEKYIHEDISIATYLILAWNHLKFKPKCFVGKLCLFPLL